MASTIRVGEDYVQDEKDTQHVSPPYEYANGSAANGGHGAFGKLESPSEAPLASLVHGVASQFNKLTVPNGKSSDSLSTPLTNRQRNDSSSFRLPTLPGASTIGFVLLCALWYLSSAFSSNTGKSILTRFRFPVTLTFVQFAFVAGYCVLFLAARERIGGRGGDHLTNRRSSTASSGAGLSALLQSFGIRKASRTMLKGTLVMSLFQIGGHIFSSMAIARVPVSTVHTIKALSPLFTVLAYAALFKVRYGSATYISLLPLTLGVMLACSFDLRANAVGFLCALGSALVFVSQNIFSKKLLPKENSSGAAAASDSHKLDKLNLLFYSSGAAFVLMIPIWLYTDGSALLRRLFGEDVPDNAGSTLSLLMFFFLNGTVHFAQNLLAFSILARTSPVTYSIASLIKRIAVICIAIVWSRQHVSPIQGFGMCLTFVGLWLYQRAKGEVEKGEKKRVQVERRSSMFLPVSAEDLKSGASTPEPSMLPQSLRPPNSTMMPPPRSSHENYSHSNSVNVSSVGSSGDDASHSGTARIRTNSFPSTNRPSIVPPPPQTSSSSNYGGGHQHQQHDQYGTTNGSNAAHAHHHHAHVPTHQHQPNGGEALTIQISNHAQQAKEISPSRAGVYR